MASFAFAAYSRAVFSLNVPVPGRVSRLAADLVPLLAGFDDVRDRHTLVVKRLGDDPGVEKRARRALRGAPAFEARIDGLGVFPDPPAGPAPVLYLAVESPGLRRIHDRLVEAFDAVEGLEGPDYVPHLTLARGGSVERAREVAEREVDPVTWTVGELRFLDARRGEPAGSVSLPASR